MCVTTFEILAPRVDAYSIVWELRIQDLRNEWRFGGAIYFIPIGFGMKKINIFYTCITSRSSLFPPRFSDLPPTIQLNLSWRTKWNFGPVLIYYIPTLQMFKCLQGFTGWLRGFSAIYAGKTCNICRDFPGICKYYRVFLADIEENPPLSPCKSL